MANKNSASTFTPKPDEAPAKFRLEASQGVGIPVKERDNEHVTPSQNGSVSVTEESKTHLK